MENIPILSICLLLSLVYIGFLLSKNNKLNLEIKGMKDKVDSKVRELENKIKAQEDLVSIDPGDKAILPNYGLCYDGKDDFSVTYEIEILEVAIDKVKVKAIDYTSTDKIARDPQRRQGIIDFLDGKWVRKNEIELVVDDQMRREKKLNQILS